MHVRIATFVAVLGVLAGACGSGDEAGDPSAEARQATSTSAVGTTASTITLGAGRHAAVVPAEIGATIATEDGGITLEIEPGALGQDTGVTVRRLDLEEDDIPFLVRSAEPVATWDLGPDGLVFDEPVGVTVRLPIPDDAEAGDDTVVPLFLAAVSDEDAEPLDELRVERDGSELVVSGQLQHFSTLAAYDDLNRFTALAFDHRLESEGLSLGPAEVERFVGQSVDFLLADPALDDPSIFVEWAMDGDVAEVSDHRHIGPGEALATVECRKEGGAEVVGTMLFGQVDSVPDRPVGQSEGRLEQREREDQAREEARANANAIVSLVAAVECLPSVEISGALHSYTTSAQAEFSERSGDCTASATTDESVEVQVAEVVPTGVVIELLSRTTGEEFSVLLDPASLEFDGDDDARRAHGTLSEDGGELQVTRYVHSCGASFADSELVSTGRAVFDLDTPLDVEALKALAAGRAGTEDEAPSS